MLKLSWHWEHQILSLLQQHSEDFHYPFIFQDFKETLVLGVPHSLGCWFWHLCQMCQETQKIINRVDWQSAWVNEKNVKYKNIRTLTHSTASTLLASPHARGGSTVNECKTQDTSFTGTLNFNHILLEAQMWFSQSHQLLEKQQQTNKKRIETQKLEGVF